MTRCDGCTHWRPWDDDFQSRGDIRLGDCLLFRTEDGEVVNAEAKLCVNVRGTAGVSTTSDFYCAQFKEKE